MGGLFEIGKTLESKSDIRGYDLDGANSLVVVIYILTFEKGGITRVHGALESCGGIRAIARWSI